MKKRHAMALIALVFVAWPLSALLGIGEIVHDPISYANALLMLAELKTQYNLQAFLATSVPVDMPSRYRTVGTTWNGLQLPYDRFGNLTGWTQEVNQGGQATGPYNAASIPLQSYGSGFSQLTPDEQTKAASQYASVELSDGTNIQTMETVGMLRANATAVDQALAGLESDSLSKDPSMNTEIAVLNKISAASVASIRTTRDTNQVLLSTLEQHLVNSKRQRDAEVSEINTQIARLAYGAQAKAQYTSTITQTLSGFRWR